MVCSVAAWHIESKLVWIRSFLDPDMFMFKCMDGWLCLFSISVWDTENLQLALPIPSMNKKQSKYLCLAWGLFLVFLAHRRT